MKRILVVVDMQNDFVDGTLGSEEAINIVDNVVGKIEEFNGDIYVTYDTHNEDYMQTREGKYLPVPHCIKGSEGWMLNNKVKNALDKKNYKEVYKPTFGSTILVDELIGIDEEKTEITLIGLCTDICVVSNAILLKTNYPELNIIVDESCCAGVTVETHQAALKTMKMCQIEIIGG